MRGGHRFELITRFRERDVEDRLAEPGAFDQELHRQRGLAGTGHALDEVEAAARQAPIQNVVETRNRGPRDVVGIHWGTDGALAWHDTPYDGEAILKPTAYRSDSPTPATGLTNCKVVRLQHLHHNK